MKENRAISQGRNLRKSWPRLSRAIELRTKKYAVSPMNWPLLGTICRFRAITSQKMMIKIVATIACSMYLSSHASHGTSGNSGGRVKSSGLGAW